MIAAAIAAAAVAGSAVGHGMPGAGNLATAAALAGLGLGAAELAARQDRVRHRFIAAAPVDLSPIWAFAGALLLHPLLVTALAVLLQLHVRWRAPGPTGALHRHAGPIASLIVASVATNAVTNAVTNAAVTAIGGHLLTGATPVAGQPAWPPAVTVGVAVLYFAAVHRGLLTVAAAVSPARPLTPAPLASTAVRPDQNFLAVATASLGGLTAAALTVHPLLALFVLPAVLCLHRAVVARQLQDAVAVDGKTGLLTAAAWHARAQRALRRRRDPGGAPYAVLVLDLDHFKVVNDTHGHLAGDRVLAAVAATLHAEVRGCDLVGRFAQPVFGGEEFVVLLAGPDPRSGEDLRAVADRIRCRVAALRVHLSTPDGPPTVISGVSVSIGGAQHPAHGTDLTALLTVADAALYEAKRAGRDTVRMRTAPDHPTSRSGLGAAGPSDRQRTGDHRRPPWTARLLSWGCVGANRPQGSTPRVGRAAMHTHPVRDGWDGRSLPLATPAVFPRRSDEP